MSDRDDWTLEDAKVWLRERWEEGADCPCCGQFAKRYRRKFSSGMGNFVIQVYRAAMRGGGDPYKFVHFKDDLGPAYRKLNGGEYSVAAYYAMIEPKDHIPDVSRMSGYWRLTEKGLDFVLRKLTVPSHVYTYNRQKRGFDGDEVDIVDVLGRHFNYRELMAGI